MLLPHEVMELVVPSSPSLQSYGGGLASSADSQPLVFELSNGHRTTYVGALEFTALPGTIVVPDRLREFFDIPAVFQQIPPVKNDATTSSRTAKEATGSRRRQPDYSPHMPRASRQEEEEEDAVVADKQAVLTIRLVTVPRARHLVLGSLNAEWRLVPNQKALLEWVLPKWVALAVNDTFSFDFTGTTYGFRVLQVDPAPVASIVDLDVTTDFVDLFEAPRQLFESERPKTTPSKEQQGEVCRSERVAANSTAAKSALFKCSHCQQQLPARNKVLHEAQCARHNTFCEECQVVVRLAEQDAHVQAFHSQKSCPLSCGFSSTQKNLKLHADLECPNRVVPCDFCSLSLQANLQEKHQQVCGDRTLYCRTCDRYVRRRDTLEHETTCLFADFDLD